MSPFSIDAVAQQNDGTRGKQRETIYLKSQGGAEDRGRLGGLHLPDVGKCGALLHLNFTFFGNKYVNPATTTHFVEVDVKPWLNPASNTRFFFAL
jgi:hypothetical protein